MAELGDIEELGSAPGEGQRAQLLQAHVQLVSKASAGSDWRDAATADDGGGGSGATAGALPGRARIWVKTWGCAHNTSDSEYMAGQLAEYGYQ